MTRRIVATIALCATSFGACGGAAAPTTTALPADASPITLDLVQMQQIGSNPTGVRISISGTKPSPCHVVQSEVHRGGDTVLVQVWATVEAGQVCAQVVTGYQATIDLGTFGPGTYHIDLNGRAYDMTV
jgi:hypothetical protein